jgi:hypothetical protein
MVCIETKLFYARLGQTLVIEKIIWRPFYGIHLVFMPRLEDRDRSANPRELFLSHIPHIAWLSGPI